MAKSKRKKKFVILFLAALAVVGCVVYAKYTQRVPPISISEEKVARRNVTATVVANGKVEPVLAVKISPEVSGEIIDLEVQEGQHVHRGDLLLKIRPDNYVAARDSAKANYKFSVANKNTSDANLDHALVEYKRNEALFNGKLISEADYLTAKTAYDVAKTGLAAAVEQVSIAQAGLDSAEVDLSKTTIYSPLDGTVSQLNSHLGERVVGTATMAGTEIMTVANLTNMEAWVDVGEMDVPAIALNQKARLDVDSFKDKKFNGIVTSIARSANNNDISTTSASSSSGSGSTSTDATKFQVKIHIEDKADFLPGMSVTANIETQYRTNVLSVPIQSVTTRLPGTNSAGTNHVASVATNSSGGDSATNSASPPAKPVDVVFVVEGDHVKMVPVKLGISDDNYYEITNGLHEGEEVVSGGYKAINHDLDDGKKTVVNKEAAALDKETKSN